MNTTTSEKPICLRAEKVRAILAGTATQLRVVVKPKPPSYINDLHDNQLRKRAPYTLEDNETGCIVGSGFQDDNDVFYRCLYGLSGDLLWVRETWRAHWDGELSITVNYKSGDHVCDFCFDQIPENAIRPSLLDWKWKPSIHMPRWASRITLEITGVRVERVQDISEEDARAEGCMSGPVEWCGIGGKWCHGTCSRHGRCMYLESARGKFERLWDSINTKPYCSWADNPWVWVIEFRRVE